MAAQPESNPQDPQDFDSQAKALIAKMVAAGAPRDDISSALDELHSRMGSPSLISLPGMGVPRSSGGIDPNSPEAKAATRGLVVTGAGLAAAPWTAGMSLAPALLTEGAAMGTGDYLYQKIRKLVDPTAPEPDVGQSLQVGAAGAGGSAATRVGLGLLGIRAGVPEEMQAPFRNPKMLARYSRTLVTPGDVLTPENVPENELGQQIKGSIKDWQSTKTPARIQKEALLQQADAAGVTINAKPIIDALEDVKTPQAKTQPYNKSNAVISGIQQKLSDVKSVPANPYAAQQPGFDVGGSPAVIRSTPKKLTPTELDSFLSKELDNRIYKLSGSPKNQATAEALANARDKIRDTLLNALPSEARTATEAAYDELTTREAVSKAFSPSLVTLETRIRNLFKPGHAEQLKQLQILSDETGKPYYDWAFKLAQQRAFTMDPRAATKYGRPITKKLLGLLAPLQSIFPPLAGGGVAAAEEETSAPQENQQ